MSFNTPAAPVAPPTAPDVIDIEVSNRSVPELFQEQVVKRGAAPAMYFKSSGKWHEISVTLDQPARADLTLNRVLGASK